MKVKEEREREKITKNTEINIKKKKVLLDRRYREIMHNT